MSSVDLRGEFARRDRARPRSPGRCRRGAGGAAATAVGGARNAERRDTAARDAGSRSGCGSSATCTPRRAAATPRRRVAVAQGGDYSSVTSRRFLSGTLLSEPARAPCGAAQGAGEGSAVRSSRVSGTIPSQPGSRRRARGRLRLDPPRISGTLPDFVAMQRVRHLSMQLPRLSGTLPELGALPRLAGVARGARHARLRHAADRHRRCARVRARRDRLACPPASTEQNLVDLRGTRLSGTLPEQLRWGARPRRPPPRQQRVERHAAGRALRITSTASAPGREPAERLAAVGAARERRAGRLLGLNGTRVVGRLPAAGHPGGMVSASPGH